MPRWLSGRRDRGRAEHPRRQSDPDPAAGFDPATRGAVLALARSAIAQAIGAPPPDTRPGPTPPSLSEPGACFVTLSTDGALHGCIGSIEPRRSLREDIVENARAAATRDRRFERLTAAQLQRTRIEVSILSPLSPIEFTDQADALTRLRPGVDGVVFRCAGRRSVFLPQVWASLPQPSEFVRALTTKAGFPPDFWSPEVALERFTVVAIHEEGADDR